MFAMYNWHLNENVKLYLCYLPETTDNGEGPSSSYTFKVLRQIPSDENNNNEHLQRPIDTDVDDSEWNEMELSDFDCYFRKGL